MQSIYFILVLAMYALSAVSANVDDIPEECRSLTYCTVKANSYPQEILNMMYNNSIPHIIEPPPFDAVSLNNRNKKPYEEDNCNAEITVKTVYHIREGLDKPWRTVVQAQSVDYVQKVRLEKCQTPNKRCFHPFTEDPKVQKYFTSYCKQEYIQYTFMVLKSVNSTETETAKAELPVCCSCRYKRV